MQAVMATLAIIRKKTADRNTFVICKTNIVKVEELNEKTN